MEAATELNVLVIGLLFLGLGSSLLHYQTYAKAKAKAIVKNKLNRE